MKRRDNVVESMWSKRRLTTFTSKEAGSSIERLAELIQTGDVAPAIGQRFALEEAAGAIRQMGAGATRGRSVIIVRTDGDIRDS